MVRSFIAIETPEEIRNKIFETFDRVRRQTSGIKWAEPAGMHLTLKFLGDVEASLIEEEIIPRLDLSLSPESSLQLTVGGVGLFPSLHKPRVFWVGIGGDAVGLKRIQSKIERDLKDLPVHHEDREFHPHLTLGRIKAPNSKNLWAKILEEYEKIDFGSFAAGSIVLFKSELTRAGANYTKLKEFKFGERSEVRGKK